VAGLPAPGATSDPSAFPGVLKDCLIALRPVSLKAKTQLPESASDDVVAAHPVRANVADTAEHALELSGPLREKVRAG